MLAEHTPRLTMAPAVPAIDIAWRLARALRSPPAGDITQPRSLYDHAQLVTGGDERLLDILAGAGLGEDETQVTVPVREREDPLPDRDGDREAGDSGHGRSVSAALD